VLKDVATSVNGNMSDSESSHQLLKIQRAFLKEGNIVREYEPPTTL